MLNSWPIIFPLSSIFWNSLCCCILASKIFPSCCVNIPLLPAIPFCRSPLEFSFNIFTNSLRLFSLDTPISYIKSLNVSSSSKSLEKVFWNFPLPVDQYLFIISQSLRYSLCNCGSLSFLLLSQSPTNSFKSVNGLSLYLSMISWYCLYKVAVSMYLPVW